MVNLTNPSTLVVVVTGCDTGFGQEITEDLYKRGGFTIYATCLTQEAADRYNAFQSSRLRASIVDVTKQADVDRLQATIEAECPQGIYCIVNNAGVFCGGFFDFASVESFQKNMDVNYMGIIRITKGLVGSLRTYSRSRHTQVQCKSLPRARILSITSVAGRVNVPGHGGYCASKHAAESILDVIRVELAPWEIDVSMIEPFYAKTNIISTANAVIKSTWEQSDTRLQKMYGPKFIESATTHGEMVYRRAMPSKWVVDTVVNSIRKKNGASKHRQLVGFWWVPMLIRWSEMLPSWFVDFMTLFTLKRAGSWPADPFLIKNTKDAKRD
ncbi:Retinol dehydrogenase 5 [Actinomortierella ambigua]|nr:Retinol dehydrogenase 5 [Actinomortierella ambigua]